MDLDGKDRNGGRNGNAVAKVAKYWPYAAIVALVVWQAVSFQKESACRASTKREAARSVLVRLH